LGPVQNRMAVGRHWIVFAIAAIGAVSWMIGMASYAGDVPGLVIVFAFATAISLASRAFVHDQPIHVVKRFVVGYGLAISLFTIAMTNWRMHGWIAAMTDLSVAQVRERIPLWAMNVFVGVICVFVVALMIVTMRASSQDSTENVGPKNDTA